MALMQSYTAYTDLTLDPGTGLATFTHNLHAAHPGAGLDMTKQIVMLTPLVGNAVPPAISAAVPQTVDAVTVIGSLGATVRVWVQAVHSVQQ